MTRPAIAARRLTTPGRPREWTVGLALGGFAAAGVLIEALLLARGSKLALFLLGAVAVGACGLLIADNLRTAFVAWVAVEGLAFPFIRYPLHHDVATFDRFAILAMGAALLLRSWESMTTRSRRLTIAFGAFALMYVLRAVLTHPLPLARGQPAYSSYQPVADAFDNVGLPFIVFLVAARTVTPARWPMMAKALAFLGTTIAAVAILEWALGFQLSTLSGYAPFIDPAAGVIRPSGPYPDPVIFGGVMLVCLAGTMYWMLAGKAYTLGAAALLVELLSIAKITGSG